MDAVRVLNTTDALCLAVSADKSADAVCTEVGGSAMLMSSLVITLAVDAFALVATKLEGGDDDDDVFL